MGALGIMWGKPVSFIGIRPQRYTKEFVDKNDKLLGRSQYFGTVIKADTKDGVIIRRHGVSDLEALPPFPEHYLPAKKGTYTLQSNGLQIKNPDYTCTWRLYSKPVDNKN